MYSKVFLMFYEYNKWLDSYAYVLLQQCIGDQGHRVSRLNLEWEHSFRWIIGVDAARFIFFTVFKIALIRCFSAIFIELRIVVVAPKWALLADTSLLQRRGSLL